MKTDNQSSTPIYSTRITTDHRVIFLFLFLFACLSNPALAQLTQTHRYERDQKNSSEYFTAISLKGNGIALVREKEKFSGNKRKWELVILDTALQEKHNLEFEIEQRHTLMGFEIVPHQLLLLFRMGETNKNSLQLVTFDVNKGEEIGRHEIKPELDFKITHFHKTGEHIVLGGYVNNEPAVLLYTPAENQIKVLPGFFQKDTEVVDIRVNQNQTFNTVLIDRSSRAERKLIFKTFDENGVLLLESIVPIEENITLQTSMSSTLEREDLVVLGTWGERTSKQSNGFFAVKVDPFNEQRIQYTHFGMLDHFLDYLKPKRATRIKEKTKEDLQSGKKPDFTAYVVPFKIEERPEGYLLLAEVYNPSSVNVYSSNPYYNNPYGYNPYGFYNPYWSGYYPGMRVYRPSYAYGNNLKNAEDIKTFASTLLFFDPNGKLRWDYSIKIDDIQRSALEQVSEFHYSPTSVVFFYKKKSELLVKNIVLQTGEVISDVVKIKLNDPIEEIRSEKNETGIGHWHDNTYFVWGYQTIRNVTKAERVRDVFYINKIQIQ
ncbi:MAG: sulfur globule family protein [Cyclobacteriaceae bacterium]|nr:sulfur globule family protein [Cyclobacteriaceae bacterium]